MMMEDKYWRAWHGQPHHQPGSSNITSDLIDGTTSSRRGRRRRKQEVIKMVFE